MSAISLYLDAGEEEASRTEPQLPRAGSSEQPELPRIEVMAATSHEDCVVLRVGPELRPGESQRGAVTIINASHLPAPVTLLEQDAASQPGDEAIALEIEETGGIPSRRIYLGRMGGVPGDGIDLGRFLAKESRTYRFMVLRSRGVCPRPFSAHATYSWRSEEPGSGCGKNGRDSIQNQNLC